MSSANPYVKQIPNAISWFRLCSVPCQIYLAWLGMKTEFIWLFSIAMISDMLDGYIARKFGLTSAYGAVLDSVADLVTFFALPVSLFLLWPEKIQPEWVYIAIGMGSYLLPIGVSYLKFKRFPSFHTWSAKLGAICSIPVLILWIAFDLPVALHLFILFQVWVAFEQLWLIYLLQEWSCDLRSVFTVLSARKRM